MKLTEKQKSILENKIYNLIKESFNENNFYENGFFEKREKKEDGENASEESDSLQNKLDVIMKWLDSAQELHSVLSYALWLNSDEGPDTEDGCRSEFSKKYNGHDDEGKPYKFTDKEINKLYNLRSDYISKAGLEQN